MKKGEDGSPSKTRTCDPLVNSQLLYQLSYRGLLVPEDLVYGRGGDIFKPVVGTGALKGV